ncbi:uncharacterized protein LOC130665440 [Microplitis mediator]|uniref:uncharacterized protein LOC130665440 n=1 Tax=Microplitis mediator TaxID=375433 RepID=UPI002552EF49|nr:uncharacterized protein LOC130665440 [Microplitis mediator]
MKISGLITLLLIISSSGSILKNKDPIPQKYYNKWEISIYVPFKNRTTCHVVPIKPRAFIADADCVHNALITDNNNTYYDIHINYGYSWYKYLYVATVNKSNIFYNEDLTSKYNESKRNIAMITTNQPVFSDNNPLLLKEITQYLYNYIYDFGEKSESMNLPNNTNDVDYTNCIVPGFGQYDAFVSPCMFSNNSFWCHYRPMLENTNYNRFRNFVLCKSKQDGKDLLVGILPAFSHRQKSTIGFETYIKIEYIGDLRNEIYNKYNDWLSKNPNQLIYRPYKATGSVITIS